jgi:hypothetical protein
MAQLFKTFLSGLLILMLACPLAFAYDASPGSISHLEKGVKLQNQSQLNPATQQYIKTLLNDTSNSQAKEKLQEIARDISDWSSAEKQSLLRFLELIEYINFLRDRQMYLENNNELLVQFILEQVNDNEPIRQELNRIQKSLNTAQPQDAMGSLKSLQSDNVLPINQLNEELARIKKDFLSYLEMLQDVNRQLRQEKGRVLKQQFSSRKPSFKTPIRREQIQDIRERLIEKDLFLKRQEENYSQLSQEMSSVHKQFQALQGQLQATDQKITDLTRELAGMSLAVFEKEKALADRENRMNVLAAELNEAQERLNLVQRIIHEKDDRIQTLEQEVTSIQKTSIPSSPKDQDARDVGDIKENMIVMQEEWRSQALANSEKIAVLEAKLQGLAEKYQKVAGVIQEKELEITQLKGNVSNREETISRLQKIFLSKDQKIVELNGIVEIYKSKLSDALATLEEREGALQTIELKLQDVELNLNEDALPPGTSPLPPQEPRPIIEELIMKNDVLSFFTH